ncbi:MAG TPA: methyltransferase domain-containing protein [Solirubrobacteraceae bacterium]|jgi:SAM-dependent methyltransferase|nr:methyltransferase domain-containing protein [Solirubrobacteraceae bacterium]
MTTIEEPDEQRSRMREAWESASQGWGRQADHLRDEGMPVSIWMLEHAELQPGMRVLELAAGPGDTGFMAAELINPGGTLITSDGADGMLAVARERAHELGVTNVEFKQLELEWIDLPTADVDVVLCRWGMMLAVDPAAAVGECRRILKPGGRLTLAVWDGPEHNQAMTLPGAVLVALGLTDSSPAGGPGPFALSEAGALDELLRDGGFVDPLVETVTIQRRYPSVRDWIGETVDLSMTFGRVWAQLDGDQRQAVLSEADRRARQFAQPDGSLMITGRSLVAVAEA